jgi:hypothetical protein
MPLDLSLNSTDPAIAMLGSQVTVLKFFLLTDKAEDNNIE